MRIVFIGPPGAGKGTQAERLATDLGLVNLSTGHILRQAKANGTPLGETAAEYMDVGRLVPDAMISQIVAERLEQPDCRGGCLFDGIPRTLAQAKTLDESLRKHGQPLDVALSFNVPRETLIERLMGRGRSDDKPEVIDRRFEEIESLVSPLLEYYREQGLLHDIDAVGTPDEVYARIRQVVDAL